MILKNLWRKYISKTSIINKARAEKEKLVRGIIDQVRKELGIMKYNDVLISIEKLKELIELVEQDDGNTLCLNEIYATALQEQYERE